jgi:DNA-directed RNA polymerase subunit M/transcription elongation factor TFIIS
MTPDACPACGADDAWFETNRASNDDRPMTEIFADFRKQFRKKPQ